MTRSSTPAGRLRQRLEEGRLLLMPGCHDALSARLAEEAGFEAAFMSGFAVSAARLGLPDTGLISFGELLAQGRDICGAVSIPLFGDGDTGFGNPLNVRRTVSEYARAGFACVMIEDQVMPKRCGHTRGKNVVPAQEARMRIKAAVDARNDGADILIIARTDARATHGLEEAIERTRAFHDIGADITFLEAPVSEAEMERYCRLVPGWKMANLVEGGKTPVLAPDRLESMGYAIAVFPLSLLSASIRAMREALRDMRSGREPGGLLDFETLKRVVGFDDYYRDEEKYRD